MTEQNQITITQRDDGVYEARDGCHKWVSKNGIDWLQQDGKPPPLRALRSAMFRHWEGEVTTQVRVPFMGLGDLVCKAAVMGDIEGCLPEDADDPLTHTERIALEGAIADSEKGLKVSLFPITRPWYLEHVPKKHCACSTGSIWWNSCDITPELSFVDTRWSVLTGERTVLNPEAVAEVEVYTGPISEWPRGRAYRLGGKQGRPCIMLHPEQTGVDSYIHSNGESSKLVLTTTSVRWTPIPGSTGRLVPEIITNETNETE